MQWVVYLYPYELYYNNYNSSLFSYVMYNVNKSLLHSFDQKLHPPVPMLKVLRLSKIHCNKT